MTNDNTKDKNANLVSVSGGMTDGIAGRVSFLFDDDKVVSQYFEIDHGNPDTKEIVVMRLRRLAETIENTIGHN